MNALSRMVPPYLRRKRTTCGIMGDVCIALIPPAVAAVYFFGWEAAMRLAVGIAACMAADVWSPRRLHGEPPDAAAVVTGLILTLSCPVGIPLWLLSLLCFLAIWLAREAFGGIGSNLFNPAMTARMILLLVFPAFVTTVSPDGISTATPLSFTETAPLSEWLVWAVGRRGGSMGETSVLLIALGYGWLVFRRVIRPYIPPVTLAAFAAVIALGGGNVAAHVFSGSIVFGAVYIFTDYAGRPASPWGEVLFAAGAGALTAVFRLYGRYPEGVCFAALAMNLCTPLLEKLTAPRVYGTRKEKLL